MADAGPYQSAVNLRAADCASGLCLKPTFGSNESSSDPPTGATCTAECSSDSDCEGESRDPDDSNDTRCTRGFACVVPFVVGPLCCKHLCVCRDFLDSGKALVPVSCQGADALATCQQAAGTAAQATVGLQSETYLTTAPTPMLDMVFLLDDSPFMAPKQDKLYRQLPLMLDALRDPSTGWFPDLRVAIVDGDLGNFQMPGAAGCGVAPDALWLEYARGKPTNFARDLDIGQVFGCVAANLGFQGREPQHPLQALDFGLRLQGLQQTLQGPFLRSNAYLALVIVTDQDDCSASNDGMFGDKPELRGESPNLRCATRAHACGGVNLTQAPPGYPTTAGFETDLGNCRARTDACPDGTDGNPSTDTSLPTACSPLEDIHALAESIKQLKPHPEEQIVVAGIFGWPRADSTGKNNVREAKYKIDRVPNPAASDTEHPEIWDSWPVCYDPDHAPRDPGTFDAEAAAWGARPGLRIEAFIDEFGENGLKYSICERDFQSAMQEFGTVAAKRLQNICLDAKLMDVDLDTPDLQPDCRVVFRTLQSDSDGTLRYVEPTASMPQCQAGATSATITSDCWQVIHDHMKCPESGQVFQALRTAAEIADSPRLEEGTNLAVQCWTCPDDQSRPGCDYSGE
jgi:hypothetical protein